LAEGWKTYWRAPGDAGIPPRFDWGNSQNIASVKLYWPRPIVFESGGMRSYGYKDEVILPIELTPEQSGQPIRIAGRIQIGVCENVCIPVELPLEANLLVASSRPDRAIQAALDARPLTAARAGVGAVTCAIEPISEGLRMTARISVPSTGGEEFTVIELPDQRIWVSEAEVSRNGRELSATSDLIPPEARPFSLNRSEVLITVLGRDRAIEIEGCAAN
ncbi:MAG: protein-disulfide reductase DsbD domain-containing protein, partial [Halocynthiibacter sp.]